MVLRAKEDSRYLWREGRFDLARLVGARCAEGFKAAPCAALVALKARAVVDEDVHPPRAFVPNQRRWERANRKRMPGSCNGTKRHSR